MRFSARGEYGVRVMVDLARRFGAGPLSLGDIAEQQAMPLAYLEQIIADLRQAGLVVARRGRRGGYVLARPPAEITMDAIVRVLEGAIAPMVCIPGGPATSDMALCVHQDYCTTRVLWLRVRDSIVEVLEGTTLADLIPGAKVPSAGATTPAGGATVPMGSARVPLPLHAAPTLAQCADFITSEE